MNSPLAKLTIKLLCLVALTFAAMAVSTPKSEACQACVQLYTQDGRLFYGCGAYGNLGHTSCFPRDSYCDTSGVQCDPTPGDGGGCDGGITSPDCPINNP
jgi:hypothetical protein